MRLLPKTSFMSDNNTFKLLNIILIDSQFKRNSEIHFSDPDFKNNFNIELNDSKAENKLFINLTINFSSGIGEIEEIKVLISMLGIFEFSENTDIPIIDFAKINGPAIIFPFIREHLSSLSLKAGINPILLPIINFVKLDKDKAEI